MILSAEKQIYDTSQKPNKTAYETAVEAMQDAANAQDTADGKRRVFITTPYPPYDAGDLWTDGTDLYVCSTARQSGSFASGDWTLATAYVTQTVLESEMETAVETVTGNLGGYVILHDSDDDGYPDELLIMDTDDITTATNVWRWNQSGLMHASSYTGTYANAAITMDGQIVADAITTGTLTGIEIISTDGTNTIDMVNGMITTTGANGGKTITSGYEYKILDAASETMGKMSITYVSLNGVMTPLGAMLELDAKGKGWMTRILTNTLSMRNSTGDSTVVELSGVGSIGGYLKLNWDDGTDKIYVGELTVSGLMANEPTIVFYDSSGNMTSWYASSRAYIKDTTASEEGYIVHGHTGNHGITVDYTTSGQIDFYVDTTYIGYATIASSDERTKTDIRPIEEKYKRAVMAVDLKNFRFNFTDDLKSQANDLTRFGAIAQDLVKALEAEGLDYKANELVDTVGEEERYVINYTPFLVARLAADEDRIKTLEERIAKLEKLLEAK